MGYPRKLTPPALEALDRLAALAEIRQLAQSLVEGIDDKMAETARAAVGAGAPAVKAAAAARLSRRGLEALTARPGPPVSRPGPPWGREPEPVAISRDLDRAEPPDGGP